MGNFSVFHWLIFGLIAFVVLVVLRGSSGGGGEVSPNGSMICPSCGSRGEPKTVTRGSLAIEIVLWLFMIIPGLIYSIWRMTSRQKACPACSALGMIPVNTPMGQRLLKE